jgi:PAS domain S-box-containing protein
MNNITAQTQLEKQLLNLSVVVEQTPAMVMVTDTNGKIEYVNPAFEIITGYKYEEVIGANPRILKSGLMSTDLYQEMWETITSGEVWRGELCNRKKNGELYWDLGTVSPIQNTEGVITNYIAVKEDITARKQNEEELQKYRQHLEDMVEARTVDLRDEIDKHKRTAEILRDRERRLAEAQRIGKLGSWEWDVRHDALSWSDETYRIFGVDPIKFDLNFQNALDIVHSDDRETVAKALENTRSDGQRLNIDHKIVLPDEKVRVINLNALPVYDELGVISLVIGTVQDITERILVEQELLEKERITKELDIGHDIQLSLLPKTCPPIDGWQFAAFYQAANQVGGDFYDFIPLSDGKIGLLIADVMGKGIPAALIMSLSRTVIRTVAFNESEPSATLSLSNQVLFQDYPQNAFLTAFFAIIDPESGIMEFANAGHNYPLWCSSLKGEIVEIFSHGVVLGMFPEVSIQQGSIEILPDDVLVFYTDGLTDAQNEHKNFYDEARLFKVVNANSHKSANDILDAIVNSWKSFVNDYPQADDLTLIVAKRSKS